LVDRPKPTVGCSANGRRRRRRRIRRRRRSMALRIQEKMERGSRKRSSSAGSEKMERVGGR